MLNFDKQSVKSKRKPLLIKRFSNDCLKTKIKAIPATNHNWSNSAMDQSQFPSTACNSFKMREKSLVHGVIGLGFAFQWLENWRESFRPITNRSNCNDVPNYFRHSFENCSNMRVSVWDSFFFLGWIWIRCFCLSTSHSSTKLTHCVPSAIYFHD